MDVWVVLKIGCIECGDQNESRLAGVFTDEAEAHRARETIADEINDSNKDVLLFAAKIDAGEGRLVREGIHRSGY